MARFNINQSKNKNKYFISLLLKWKDANIGIFI